MPDGQRCVYTYKHTYIPTCRHTHKQTNKQTNTACSPANTHTHTSSPKRESVDLFGLSSAPALLPAKKWSSAQRGLNVALPQTPAQNIPPVRFMFKSNTTSWLRRRGGCARLREGRLWSPRWSEGEEIEGSAILKNIQEIEQEKMKKRGIQWAGGDR